MRLTIERMRTLVLAAGVLLVVALAVFLGIAKWRNMLNGRDLPKRLGVNIQQEASGVTYTQSRGGHMIFKIHASRAERLKSGHSLLHDVKIEFYAKDGRTIDSITGSDFEYDQKTGIASALGKVEITLTRPMSASTISANEEETGKAPAVPSPKPSSAGLSAPGAIHVETEGLSFNENTGVATTAKRVDFSIAKGSGSAVGALYDSQQGFLRLDHAVELTTKRGGQQVVIHAQLAEFKRDAQLCQMMDATADYRGGQTSAGEAKILFRSDGSAQRLDATNGFTLTNPGGGQVEAPSGWLVFNAQNEPQVGRLTGGVTLNSASADRQLHGTGASADLKFSPEGELRLVEFNQGVEMHSESQRAGGEAHEAALHVSRTWRSPVASVDFRPDGPGRVEPASLQGSGGVVVTTETRRGNGAPVPSRLAADAVTGTFGPGSELTGLTGTGHASMVETTADGAKQTASADRLVARFEPAAQKAETGRGAAGIHSAVLEGHVVFVQKPAVKPGARPEQPLKATAGKAVYESAGEWLHLTESPRVEDEGLQITAKKIDVSQQSQKGFAYGDVKATWMGGGSGAGGTAVREAKTGAGSVAFGGQGPAHVIAEKAQFSQARGVAIFQGHARMWQEANSIAAPEIVLNREKQTLVARSSSRSEPVLAVLLSTGEPAAGLEQTSLSKSVTGKRTPSVVRVRGGEFTYSDAEHRAVIVGGGLGPVVAMTGGATCTAHKVVLRLRPRGTSGNAGAPEVERVTASGDVVVSSQGRRGTGSELVYSGQTGAYVLTGTASSPPRLSDPERGTVTGTALIFNSRDDSVSIEGRGRETRTETVVPK